MKVELHECQRCCFCMPLRRGILAWGYLKLTYTIVVLVMFCSFTLLSVLWGGFRMTLETLVMAAILVLLVVDVIFTNVLLLGGHTKGHKLLQVYLVYGVVNLGIEVLLLVVFSVCIALNARPDPAANTYIKCLRVLASGVLYIICNFYILLLVRSEIRKLKNENCKIEFVNNAAEAVCSVISAEQKIFCK